MVGERTVGMHRRLIAFCAARAWRRAAWPREEVAVAVASSRARRVDLDAPPVACSLLFGLFAVAVHWNVLAASDSRSRQLHSR